MAHADALSRSPHMDEPTPEEVRESEEFITKLVERGKQIQRVLSMEGIDLKHVKMAQYANPELSEVINWIQGEAPSKEELREKSEDLQTYYGLLGSLYLDDAGIIRLKHRCREEAVSPKERLLIPNDPELRDMVFLHSHVHKTAGHFG